MADGAVDGAALFVFVFLLAIVGDRVGDDDRAAVSIFDSLLLLLLPLVVLVGLSNAVPLGAACIEDDIRNSGLATDFELSYGF